MALNNTTADALGAAISAAITALSDADKADPVKVWKVIAEKIYLQLKADAVVNVASVSGVTSGTSASGSGTGTLA
jgi:ribosomal protein L18E